MWAFSIDDRTLLCLAVNVTKHGISNFGRNNFKFSKTVAYITYIVFQCSLSQGYETLNRGFSGLWVRVCFLPPRSFRWAWHGMVDVFLGHPQESSARNSRCISTAVPTQNKGAVKTYSTQPTIKERGEEAHVRSAVQGLPHTSSPVSSSRSSCRASTSLSFSICYWFDVFTTS